MPASSSTPRHPLLYELNARTHVRGLGPRATLDDLDDDHLDELLPPGLDWLYLLGVWQTGSAGAAASRSDPATRADCVASLPDLTDEDICGSCFAIVGYRVHDRLGGDTALARLRTRLADRGVRLMLDFIPNHTALDHPWVTLHPERFVSGTDADLAAAPDDWVRPVGEHGPVLAHGRDPNFPGWQDTLQLDYSSPALQAAMREELLTAAGHCDGLRCDMAMLLLPAVFERTWGRTCPPFWPDAIARVRARHPDFSFLAEVYWGLEPELRAAGFDHTYDKELYDALVDADARRVVDHLRDDETGGARSARFLENHDEQRAAATFGTGDRHRAAAVVASTGPGLRFFHHGQFGGRRIHVPMHLCRAPAEGDDLELESFYAALLKVLGTPALHDGEWAVLEPAAAWPGNPSHADLLAWTWATPAGGAPGYVAAVNLSDHWSQAYVPLPDLGLSGRTVVLDDRLGPFRYERSGDDLVTKGLYLDVPPWAHHLFAIT